jgi:hypothetical protein
VVLKIEQNSREIKQYLENFITIKNFGKSSKFDKIEKMDKNWENSSILFLLKMFFADLGIM